MNGDGDNEGWLTNWEQQYVNSVDEQPDCEQSFTSECENSNTRIWSAFQDSAAAIAQLYRDRLTGEPATLWLQFQTAAGTVTSLYKESSEGLRRSSDLAKQHGYQKRNKELLNWAKKKRRLIRREDLLAYLSGKMAPKPNHHQYHHHPHHRTGMSPRPRNISPPPGVIPPESLGLNSELHTFREALARSPLSRITRGSDLCNFIAGEMARHCNKRPASPSDVTMDSPTQQKRPRYM